MPLAQLDNIVIRRGDRRALGPLSLSIEPGEFVGVVGPNGAGKSTLLLALAGRLALSEGSARLCDIDVAPGPARPRPQWRRRIGVLFQKHDFVPDLPFTVEDVVRLGRAGLSGLGRRPGADDAQAAREAMDELGLLGMRRRLYRELSGGERQKTQLARLLAQKADLLLLDEPTAGLDLDWQERLTRLTDDLCRKHGCAVAMVTHEVDHIPACCARALLLKDGRALAAGTPDEVFKPDTLSRLYGRRMEVVRRGQRFHAYGVPGGEVG